MYARFKENLAYTAGAGWLIFDGQRWKRGETGAALDCAMDVARKIADEIPYKLGEVEKPARARHAERSGSRQAVDAMVHLARPMFTIADDMLDRDKFLLNVENGTIDLRTGELGPHDPADFITKIAPVAFDPEAKCPTFLRVVNWITKGDREFVNYLRRAFGYCLTGDTTEQVFFFVIGPGRTGKSSSRMSCASCSVSMGSKQAWTAFLPSSTTTASRRTSRAYGELASSWRPRPTSTGRSTKPN